MRSKPLGNCYRPQQHPACICSLNLLSHFWGSLLYRLQQEVFPTRAFWPLLLLLAGLGLMLAAANYAALRVALNRWRK